MFLIWWYFFSCIQFCMMRSHFRLLYSVILGLQLLSEPIFFFFTSTCCSRKLYPKAELKAQREAFPYIQLTVFNVSHQHNCRLALWLLDGCHNLYGLSSLKGSAFAEMRGWVMNFNQSFYWNVIFKHFSTLVPPKAIPIPTEDIIWVQIIVYSNLYFSQNRITCKFYIVVPVVVSYFYQEKIIIPKSI